VTHLALTDKTVLVTGGATGIGRATAIHLAEAGARVLAAGLDEANGETLEAEQRALGRQLKFYRMDVTNDSDVRHIVLLAERECGGLNAIVNSAAVCNTGRRLEDVSDAEWDITFNTNVKGIFYVCRASLPALRRAGGGSVVNIASVHAVATAVGHAAYSASKGAVLSLSRQLALDYAVDHIRVNALVVGSVDTRMSQRAFEAAGGAESLGLSFEANALPRIAQPRELAQVIAFLISDASSFITGTGLVADGGMLARLM
jgi:NAD(P)-dependent dehydrogenase (short-subunit alcohol dehydrogenase family)